MNSSRNTGSKGFTLLPKTRLGDGGQGLVLVLDLDAFLGFQRLMQTLVVAPPDQGTAGVLVDDQHLPLGNHIVLIAVEEFLSPDRITSWSCLD